MDQIDLSTASQLFDTEVNLYYQSKQSLMNTIQERHGVVGKATNIPVSDFAEMSEGNFAPTNIPVTPINETNNICLTEDFRLKTVIGGAEKTLFAYDKIVDHAKIHGLAAARQLDLVKINALFNDANFSDVAVIDFDLSTNLGMSSTKMTAALDILQDNGVEVSGLECSMWLPALLKQSFFSDDRVVNFFYNSVKPLTNNQVKSYLDVDIRFLSSQFNNKLPTTTPTPGVTQWLVPIIHQSAMVQTFNRDVKTSITWVPQEDRWELLTVVTTGAKLTQTRGAVVIQARNPYSA